MLYGKLQRNMGCCSCLQHFNKFFRIYFLLLCATKASVVLDQLYFPHSYSHDYFIFNNFNMLVMMEEGKHKAALAQCNTALWWCLEMCSVRVLMFLSLFNFLNLLQ